jgi:hypothetical protein
LAVWASVVSVVGCASAPPPRSPPREEQSYEEAIRAICDVDARANVDAEDVLGASAAREEYLLAHVKNSDGIYFLTLFRVNGPREQSAMLEKEAAEVKLGRCPLVATLRAGDDPPAASAVVPEG